MNLPNMPKLQDGIISGHEKSKYVLTFIQEYTSPLYKLLDYSIVNLKKSFEIMHGDVFLETLNINNILEFVDEFIEEMPAWPTEVYRGISIDAEELIKHIENHSEISMNGISSWTTVREVAEEYARGSGDTEVLYVLKNNKSGCNISHLSMYYEEREVLAPSNTKYEIIDIEKMDAGKKNKIIIYLKELEVLT